LTLDLQYPVARDPADTSTKQTRSPKKPRHPVAKINYGTTSTKPGADRIIATRGGRIVADGTQQIFTPPIIERVFGLPCRILHDPQTCSRSA
jgi:hypothetical protein